MTGLAFFLEDARNVFGERWSRFGRLSGGKNGEDQHGTHRRSIPNQATDRYLRHRYPLLSCWQDVTVRHETERDQHAVYRIGWSKVTIEFCYRRGANAFWMSANGSVSI
jgi:hypothetical protein